MENLTSFRSCRTKCLMCICVSVTLLNLSNRIENPQELFLFAETVIYFIDSALIYAVSTNAFVRCLKQHTSEIIILIDKNDIFPITLLT